MEQYSARLSIRWVQRSPPWAGKPQSRRKTLSVLKQLWEALQNLWPLGARERFMRPEGFWGALLCGLLQVAPRDHMSLFAGITSCWNWCCRCEGSRRSMSYLSGWCACASSERLLSCALAFWTASHIFLGKWAILLQSGNRVLGSSASPGGRAGSWHVASVSVIGEGRYAVLENNCL